jgi:hypothetical protein
MRRLRLPLLLFVIAAPALAQSVSLAAERTVSAEKPAPAVAPATLTVWNHPIAVFRAPVRQVSPAGRAARAAKRIEEIPADVLPDEIRADVATVGDLNGVLVAARDRILFGIVPEDLDPSVGETLESVGRQAVDQLRAVLQARADQRRLPVLLRGLGLWLGATALLALVLWVVGRAAAPA